MNLIFSLTMWSSAHPLQPSNSFPTAELNGDVLVFGGEEAGNNEQRFCLFLQVAENVLGPSLGSCWDPAVTCEAAPVRLPLVIRVTWNEQNSRNLYMLSSGILIGQNVKSIHVPSLKHSPKWSLKGEWELAKVLN